MMMSSSRMSQTATARGCISCAASILLATVLFLSLGTLCWSFQPASQHRYGTIITTRCNPVQKQPYSKLLSSTSFQQDDVSTSTDEQSSSSSSWKPSISSLSERKSYLRAQSQHCSENLGTLGFHHVEFYTGDAFMTAKRFELALGMPITCWSSLATGNDVCVTYGLECGGGSGDSESEREPGDGLRFMITAPLSRALQKPNKNKHPNGIAVNTVGSNVDMTAPLPLPGYNVHAAHEFYSKHGLAVRAVGVEVKDARVAYEAAVLNGAVSVLEPTSIPNLNGEKNLVQECQISEVGLYGDVVLRFVSFEKSMSNTEKTSHSNSSRSSPFLPNLSPYPSYKPSQPTYGLTRIDHTVGNVPNLLLVQNYIQAFTGYHPFAEFTPEDIGTVESGLNSVVLASDNEAVLLPLNEPTLGKRKSQIQTYLEQNEGPGVQHIAIKTDDIFHTIGKMRYAQEHLGGFELMVRPSSQYYEELPSRLGDKLSMDQYEQLEKLGILADADDEGVLLQIFTKPLGDRPTLFLEIIQRIGCALDEDGGGGDEVDGKESLISSSSSSSSDNNSSRTIRRKIKERPGCGGFGQGNFRELFKAIENYEKRLNV